MDIPGVTPEIIARLLSQGLARDVAELYRMKPAELAGVKGLTGPASKEIFDAIAGSRQREGWRLLFGLSIPDLQPSEAQALLQKFGSVDNVFAASADRLLQTPGLGEASARSVVHWHSDSVNRRLVRRLFKAGLNFKA